MSHTEFAARTFGLALEAPPCPAPVALPLPEAGCVLGIVGPSGAGKSLALNALGADPFPEIDPQLGVLEHFHDCADSARVMRMLAKTGLADGRLWSMRAGALSAGEQQRLRLALALCRDARTLVLDEFDAHLDAETACALAQALGRIVRKDGLRLVASTHRPETLAYLGADRVIEIDAGAATEKPRPARADMLAGLEFVRGRALDWRRFSRWHYLGEGRPGPSCGVWLARLRGRDVGIAMFGFPHLLLSARKDALPPGYGPGHHDALNRDVRLLQRVVIEPRFRCLGIARRLVWHGVHALGVPYIECLAQMGAFSGFLLGAGFRQVRELDPPPALAALSRFCERRELDAEAMHDPAYRAVVLARLPQRDAEALQRHLNAVVDSRVRTGHGSRRKTPGCTEHILNAALSRIRARPSYFIWSKA